MKRFVASCALALFVGGLMNAQTAPDSLIYRPDAPVTSGPTITYNGGPVMLGTVNLYVVYYGDFTPLARTVVNDFLSHIGGTPLYNINTTYFDGSFTHLSNSVHFAHPANVYNDPYSLGHSINDAQTQQLIANAISGGHLPIDDNGVYFVLTAADVAQHSSFGGFCTVYCGYHSPSTTIVSGHVIKYSFVGDVLRCPTGCSGNVAVYGDTTSPNGTIAGDGMVSIIFHELSESATDPEVNMNTAWAGSGGENGDLCNFNFGTTFLAPNGSHANQNFGGRNWLLQQMFKLTQQVLPTDTGVCAQHNP